MSDLATSDDCLAVRLRQAASGVDPHLAALLLEAAAALSTDTDSAALELAADVETADLCSYLQGCVERQRGRRPKVTSRWVKDMALLMRLGPKHVEGVTLTGHEVREMIAATFKLLGEPGRDGFCWADQIRSPGALRDHWEQLEVALRRTGWDKPSADEMAEAVRRLKAAGL